MKNKTIQNKKEYLKIFKYVGSHATYILGLINETDHDCGMCELVNYEGNINKKLEGIQEWWITDPKFEEI